MWAAAGNSRTVVVSWLAQQAAHDSAGRESADKRADIIIAIPIIPAITIAIIAVSVAVVAAPVVPIATAAIGETTPATTLPRFTALVRKLRRLDIGGLRRNLRGDRKCLCR
ncbi:hypothetical protein D3C86_1683110 [compost metagenome]